MQITDVTRGRVQKARGTKQHSQRHAAAIDSDGTTLDPAMLTPDSMTGPSMDTEETSFTDSFADLELIKSEQPPFEAPHDNYDMRGFDDECF